MKRHHARSRVLIESFESRELLSAAAWSHSIRATAPAIHARATLTEKKTFVALPHRSTPKIFSTVTAVNVSETTSNPPPIGHATSLATPVPLTAPTTSLLSASATQINLAAASATGGSGIYTYQWYRSTAAVFTPSPVTLLAGETALTLNDTSALPGIPYFYRLTASDGITTVASGQIIAALNIPTTPINRPYQPGPILIAYIGSSTWAINQGSGQIPMLIDSSLHTAYPAANLSTFNGAVGGTTTVSFLPGTALSNAVKAAVTTFSGYKILRLMIGSNDATAGQPVSTWLANMQTIINDALTWPVDQIILEEIGLRLDLGDPRLDLIRQYNAARASLAGPRISIGTAHTFENQALHLPTLSPDNIHQTNAGQLELASHQTTELVSLFTPPTTINLAADNTAYTLSLNASHTIASISPNGASPSYQYSLGAMPALTFNLTGNNATLTIDGSNGTPAANITVNATPGTHSKLFFTGQSPSQPITLTDYQLTPANGPVIAYQNLAELHLTRGTFTYSGNLSTLEVLNIGPDATFNWS